VVEAESRQQVLGNASSRSGVTLVILMIAAAFVCVPSARADTETVGLGVTTDGSTTPEASPTPSDPVPSPTPSGPPAPTAPAPPTTSGPPTTPPDTPPVSAPATPPDTTGTSPTPADRPGETTPPAGPSGDEAQPADDPAPATETPAQTVGSEPTPAVAGVVPVAVPVAKAIQPTRRDQAPPARDGPINPALRLAGALGSALSRPVAIGTSWSGRLYAGPTPATGLALYEDLGPQGLRIPLPQLEPRAPSASKRHHGSGSPRSKHLFGPGQGSSASTSSTASGSSASSSGSSAAGMIALVTCPVVRGGTTKLLMSPPSWQSLTLLSLLERPG
jgi:hypothetical protein